MYMAVCCGFPQSDEGVNLRLSDFPPAAGKDCPEPNHPMWTQHSGTVIQKGTTNVVVGSSHIGGSGALARSRQENGKKLIVMKTRNSAEHVNEHRPSYNYNGMYLCKVYTNVNKASPTDVYYKKRSYLPLRLLEIFPNLPNDLVPAVRSSGFRNT
ncbi:hypothetical protein ACET3Z_005204 [Daucus carota]